MVEKAIAMNRILVILLAVILLLGLWVTLMLFGFPVVPCFLWADFVIYCYEGRLYMS